MKHGVLKSTARRLRENPPPSETWARDELKKNKVFPANAQMNMMLGPWIPDFYFPDIRTVLEIDGAYHLEPARQEKDRVRDRWMAARQIRTIRVRAFNKEDLRLAIGELQRLFHLVDAGRFNPGRRVFVSPAKPNQTTAAMKAFNRAKEHDRRVQLRKAAGISW